MCALRHVRCVCVQYIHRWQIFIFILQDPHPVGHLCGSITRVQTVDRRVAGPVAHAAIGARPHPRGTRMTMVARAARGTEEPRGAGRARIHGYIVTLRRPSALAATRWAGPRTPAGALSSARLLTSLDSKHPVRRTGSSRLRVSEAPATREERCAAAGSSPRSPYTRRSYHAPIERACPSRPSRLPA